MLSNYLHIAFRSLRKKPTFPLINVVGLALGMACCIVIGLYVHHERSYDQFHARKDQIYRLNKMVTLPEGGVEHHAITGGLMGPAIVERLPEVEQSVRVLPWFDDVIMQRDVGQREPLALKVSDVVIADSNFFDVFGFDLQRGNPEEVLAAPLSLVLTEPTARRLFGDSDPMGQVVIGLNGLPFTVTGIVEDTPVRSHFRFNALISWASTAPGEATLGFDWLNRWSTQVVYTYVVLAGGVDPEGLRGKFDELVEEFLPRRAGEYQLYVQPLEDIYLGSSRMLFTRALVLGNGVYVQLFVLVGALILLIACINYMNLATARFVQRAQEVGVRKVLGARKRQLIARFFIESMVITCLGLLASIGVVKLMLPVFRKIMGQNFAVDLFDDPYLMVGIVVLALVTGLIAGGYPALFLSGLQPVHALKKLRSGAARGLSLRKVLVVTQFAISIVLIVSVLVVIRQTRYMNDKDPGYDRDQLVVLPIGSTGIQDRYEPFKQALVQHPGITHAAGSNSVPGTREAMMSFQLHPEGRSEEETVEAYVWRVDDYDLLETYRLSMAEGRYFEERYPTDASRGVVINETLADRLNWEDPVGKRLDISGETEESYVIGVLEDFHFESLHHPIESLVLYVAPRYENLTVRIRGNSISETLAFVRQQWEQFDPSYPFEYTFLDESAGAQYEAEQRLMSLLFLFAGLAIFIACMGLFGLAAVSTQQRTKEIGIRKVVGASVVHLVRLLSEDFVKLVGWAFLVAAPIAYLVMRRWLEGFAFRIEMAWWMFGLAGLLAVAIALLTVSVHCIKAARSNPVLALQHE